MTRVLFVYLLVGLAAGVWCLPLLSLRRHPARIFAVIVTAWPMLLARAIARSRR